MAFRPFKFLAKVGKGLIRGIIDALPFSQVKDAVRDLDIKKALQIIQKAKGTDEKTLQQIVAEVHDILDDGELNESYSQAKVKARARIIGGGLPVLAYIMYAILTGDFTPFF